MSNKETMEVIKDFEKKIMYINFSSDPSPEKKTELSSFLSEVEPKNEQEYGNLAQRIFVKINQKVEQIEREGDELLKVNPSKFHNIATGISLSVAAVFFGLVALIHFVN